MILNIVFRLPGFKEKPEIKTKKQINFCHLKDKLNHFFTWLVIHLTTDYIYSLGYLTP